MISTTRALSRGLLLVLGLSLAGTWWLNLPRRTAERFVALASSGRFEQADAMLTGTSALALMADHSVRVRDAHGDSAQVSSARLPFVAGRHVAIELPRPGLLDRLLGRYWCAIAATGFGAPERRGGEPVTLVLAIEGRRVRIDRVE